MRKFIVAAVQMDSTSEKSYNLSKVDEFVKEAAERGAKLISLPEHMNYIGNDSIQNAEAIPGGTTFKLLSKLAVEQKVWIHGGSIYEKSPRSERPYNTTMVIDPQGQLRAKYSKLHMFDVDIKDGPSIRESDKVTPGEEIVTMDTQEVGHLGFSICYDIRFGELFRLMALRGAQIFLTPANFVLNTGKDHWEPILRTRSIENGCYTIAAGQCGIKPSFHSYGKSMIVDPWGNVIAKASDKPGVITAEIDLDYLDKVRKQILTLENRRSDIYSLE